jgi:uncharacterized protein YdaU (DUF1376 family)
MDRLFRIDFYPSEWLVQTGKMTLMQRGIFVQVISMIYANRGPIENDAAWIGRASNCSSRMARSIIKQLVDSDALQISGGKLTQRRCERELDAKRIHLEHSAKGGRTSAENKALSNNNNGLTSTPIPSPSTPRKDHDLLKNGKDKMFISAAAIEKGRAIAPGWDIYFLESKFTSFVNGGTQPRYPDAAFLAWIPKFTKSKSPDT